MNTDLTKLFEGLDLSEEAKERIDTIFEAEVAEKVKEKEAELTEKFEAASTEYKDYLQKEFEGKVGKYIEEEVIPTVAKYADYAVKEFFKENEVKIDSTIKNELAENFLKSLAEASKEYNVVIPEGSDDQVKSLEAKVQKMQERLDSALDESKELQEEINKRDKAEILNSVCGGLSEKQREKLVSVSESVSFHDKEQYTKAVSSLKESYFPDPKKDELNEEEEGGTQPKKVDESKKSYTDRLLDQI